MLPVLFAAFMLISPAEERLEYAISQMVEQGLPREQAESLLKDQRLQLLPQRDVAPRKIDWDQVIATLVAPGSVKQGSDFLARYRESLDRAEAQYGVDKGVLVGLLRLESNFGRNTGNYGTFNVFYTLMTIREEERRWRFAADNLAALAVFCYHNERDCFQVRGSYGGALGAAQFLPYSVLKWGVDGNGDGIVNPDDMEDAIASAANFLVEHGWHEGHAAALGRYYGSADGYPRAVLAYAEALRKATPGLTTPASAESARTNVQ